MLNSLYASCLMLSGIILIEVDILEVFALALLYMIKCPWVAMIILAHIWGYFSLALLFSVLYKNYCSTLCK